LPTKVTVKS